jgi:hypothetical protein
MSQASISKSKTRRFFQKRQIEGSLDPTLIRWTWASRFLDYDTYEINHEETDDPPIPGDLALFRVTHIGSHTRLINTLNQKLRIYTGDLFVGVFGNRYATDALEATVEGVRNISLLTTAGMVGTVKSKHRSVKRTTQVAFVGYLKTTTHARINSKKIRHRRANKKYEIKNLIAVIGSGMNSGKTTFCRKLIKSLSQKGLRVAACKLTGSISPRDYDEMLSASAVYVTDFSDYGFPSTYKCDKDELMILFETMLADIEKSNPDIIIMEIADGILQRETKMILNEPLFQKMTRGIIVTAESAPSALYTVGYLEQLGFRIIGLSGAVTSSPLYVKEFADNNSAPILSSATSIVSVLPDLENFLKSDQTIK